MTRRYHAMRTLAVCGGGRAEGWMVEMGTALLAGALAIVGVAAVVGWRAPRAAAYAGSAGALLAACAIAAAWALPGERLVDLPWSPLTGSRFVIEIDALGGPLAVFAVGIASPILLFTAGYLPRHLEEHSRPIEEQSRFVALMLAFMLSMLLLLVAQDLLVLFLALELTAMFSFLLIRFDPGPAGRRAAALALIVTVGSSILYLTGALLVARDAGTTVLAELADRPSPASPVAAALLVGGLLGKSAQFPLHIWLPRAMVAPTPVSAYLHSAALVAAGVFVMLRIRPLVEAANDVLDALALVGMLSVAVGGTLALVSDELKRILAYSTVAQYGYATFMVGIGGKDGLAGAAFFILAHGLCKCALFMTAGAITITTGADRLSESRGVLRSAPVLALSSGVAAAGLAGAPLTIGYFKDELLFAAGSQDGRPALAFTAIAAALTVAYTARFWLGLFTGGEGRKQARVPLSLTLPVLLLAILVVLGGVWTAPLAEAFSGAGAVAAAQETPVHLEYRFELKPEIVAALSAWGVGLLAAATLRRWQPSLAALADATAPMVGPAALARRLDLGLRALSDALHRMELRDLRDRLAGVIVPTAVIVLLGLVGQGAVPHGIGPLEWSDLPLAAALGAVAAAALMTARASGQISLVLQLSFIGFALALVFALAGAPDVALVIALVETVLTLLFVAFLWRVDPQRLDAAREEGERRRAPWAGLFAAVMAFAVAWLALEAPGERPLVEVYAELAEKAHGKDIVTVILADFRGLDTAVEVSVLAVGVMGAVALAWGRTDD